jgi:hypothetical protein
MPYEYYLEPEDENKTFPQPLVEGMHDYLKHLPSYVWADGTYILFQNVSEREHRVPLLLAEPQRNHYLDPTININPKEVILSSVVDPDVDCYLYEFVLWCQERWPCKLYYGSQPVSPEELMAEP